MKRTHDEQIAELQRQIEKLEQEKKAVADLTPAQRVAEVLHEYCTWNHTDGCGWHYGSWKNSPLGDTHEYYLEHAKRVLAYAHGDEAKAIEMIRVVRETRW